MDEGDRVVWSMCGTHSSDINKHYSSLLGIIKQIPTLSIRSRLCSCLSRF